MSSNPFGAQVVSDSRLLTPTKEAHKSASFAFILTTASGYEAEGFYPSINPSQYKRIIAVLEESASMPTVILP